MRGVAGGAAGLGPQKLAFAFEKWPRIKMGCKRSPDVIGGPNLYPSLCIARPQGPASDRLPTRAIHLCS